MVYGHDKLQFFGRTEPCCAIPLYVRVEKGHIRIPEGTIHGVTPGTEYTRLASDHQLIIKEVDNTCCLIKIPQEAYSIWKSGDEIFRSLLSTTQPFRVLVDPSLPSVFNEALLAKLKQHINGPVEVVTAISHEDCRAAAVELKYTNGTIELLKQQPEAGHYRTTGKGTLCSWLFPKSKHRNSDAMERIPGLELPYSKEEGSEQPTAASASAIIHLFRYQQIFGLRDVTSKTECPFTVTLIDQKGSAKLSKGQNVFSPTKVRFVFKNLSSETLYFTVLTFGPGHHIQQLYPRDENSRRVAPGWTNQECQFKLVLPEKLQPGPHKDTLRTFVTKTSDISLKGLELPDIWSGEQEFHSTRSPLRDIQPVQEFEWWMDDFEVWTRNGPDA
ncbi:hypothetical protein ACHAPA_012143 [Fusarium lateritium]